MTHDTTARSIFIEPTVYDIQRFWSHITFSDQCWEWSGHICNGYGTIKVDNHPIKAHRFSYFIHFGQIPEGQFVCHRCDNKRCVRPDHLFVGTHDDNMRDMWEKGRGPSGDRNAMRKHPGLLSGEKHGNAKLTEEAVRIIRREYVHVGLGQKNPKKRLLAERFGIDPQNVYLIATGKSWKHVK